MSENKALEWAAEVARHLPCAKAEAHPDAVSTATIQLNDPAHHGASLCVRIGGWRNEGRVRILGCFPDGMREVYLSPVPDSGEITVSVDRPAEQAAREITRRCLPKYLPDHDRAVAAVQRHRDQADDDTRAAEVLAALITGGRVTGRDRPEVSGRVGETCITAHVGGNVRFESLYVTREQAARIITALRG